jgi:hypothetical protein
MTATPLLAAALLAAGCASAGRCPTDERAYYAFAVNQLAEVDVPPSAIDYLRLRQGRALDRDEAAATALGRALAEASAAGRPEQAQSIATEILDRDFTDLSGHLTQARALHDRGDRWAATFHEAIAEGLARSIFSTGDGSTPARAFRVTGPREQQTVLALLGFDFRGCSWRGEGPRREAVTCSDRRGQPITRYFETMPPPAGRCPKQDAAAAPGLY